tara:strand:+ start:377 stop:886 length:510 start_codon:yes stop_codon:yes gene_type:complete
VTDLKGFRSTLNDFAKLVIKGAKAELRRQKKVNTGATLQSLDYKIETTSDGFKLAFVDTRDKPIADFVDKGVSGIIKKYNTPYSYKFKRPPANVLIDWVSSRRFQFRDKDTGRFLSYATTGYMIRESIFKRGLKPTLFFTKPFNKYFEMLPDQLFEAYAIEIDRFYSEV